MPVWQIGGARQYGLEALPDEEPQVAPQQGGKSDGVVHWGAFLFERGPGFGAALASSSAVTGLVLASTHSATKTARMAWSSTALGTGGETSARSSVHTP